MASNRTPPGAPDVPGHGDPPTAPWVGGPRPTGPAPTRRRPTTRPAGSTDPSAGGRGARRPRTVGAAVLPWVAAARRLGCLALIIAFHAVANQAWAQSCGGCAGPPIAGAGGAQRDWLGQGEGSVRVAWEYEVKDATYDGRDEVVNDFDETLRSNRGSLEVRYGISDDWTVALTYHHPRFQYRLKPPGGERVESTFRGPGDTTLVFGRRFPLGDEGDPPPGDDPDAPGHALLPWLSERGPANGGSPPDRPRSPSPPPVSGPSFTVWAGLSIPTGNAEEPLPEAAVRDVSVANLQTGTGTFDPILKVRFDGAGDGPRVYAEASVRWPVTENRYDYRTGRSTGVTVGAEADAATDLRVHLAATFLRVERDEIDGDRVAVGGGSWVYVTPGLSFDVSDRVTLDASVRLTAWRDTETKLTDSDAAFQVGLTCRF